MNTTIRKLYISLFVLTATLVLTFSANAAGDAHVHTVVEDKAVKATCTDIGLTAGSHCSTCGEIIKAQRVIKRLEHTVVVDEKIEATCDEIGFTEGSHCSVCGQVLVSQKPVKKKAHTVVTQKGVSATCTQIGISDGKYCSVCDRVIVAQKLIAALGHKLDSYEKREATCTKKGYDAYVDCKRCDYTTYVEFPAKGHVDEDKSGVCDVCSEILKLGVTAKLVAKQSTDAIKLSWLKVDGAQGYRVFQKNAKGWKALGTVSALTATIKKLSPGMSYTFAVRAYTRQSGKVVWADKYAVIVTATQTQAPAKVVSKQNSSAIALSWSAVKGADGYRIFYASGGKWVVAVASTEKTSHTFKNLAAGRGYTFAVRPYQKTASGIVWGRYTTHKTVTAPDIVVTRATSPALGYVIIYWDKVQGADGYQLYYKVGQNGYQLHGEYKTPEDVKFTLNRDEVHTFAVRAYTELGGKRIYGKFKPLSMILE